jgi:N-acetylglutamate synthase-like GNAT family acetyltransferase
MTRWIVREALAADISSVKRLFDQHRIELGFVLRPTLEKAVQAREVLVVVTKGQILGAVHFHHRHDKQTTLYHIAVSNSKHRKGIGTALIKALGEVCVVREQIHILLKCPADLSANLFYAHLGFQHERTESGKRRALHIWVVKCDKFAKK